MYFRLLILLAVITGLTVAPALAQSKAGQKPLGSFGVWKAFSYQEGDQQICYMVKSISFPKSGKFKRGPAYLMITHRPVENSNDVVSYTSGYNFKPASDVKITSGRSSFDLFTQKDTAWSRDSKTDHALASTIREASSLKIKGTPSDQKYMAAVTDTLDLKGAGQAYQAIGKACGLIKEEPKKPAKSTATPKKKHK